MNRKISELCGGIYGEDNFLCGISDACCITFLVPSGFVYAFPWLLVYLGLKDILCLAGYYWILLEVAMAAAWNEEILKA